MFHAIRVAGGVAYEARKHMASWSTAEIGVGSVNVPVHIALPVPPPAPFGLKLQTSYQVGEPPEPSAVGPR